jgi:autotransporter-associated beta strand protein
LGNSALSVSLGKTGGFTGTLVYTGNTATSTKKFTMAAGGMGAFQVDTNSTVLTLSGAIDGSGTLQKNGPGTLTLTGTNTYSGGTDIYAGTLTLSSAQPIGTSGSIGLYGGTLQYSASNTVDYSSRFSSNAGQHFQIDTNGQNVTFASALQGVDNWLTKSGLGTLTLTGANNYGYATTVSAGTLTLSGSGKLGNASALLLVEGTGTLNIGVTNQSVYSAAFRSGSLRTARDAAEIYRTVMAIPGPITSPTSDGCHRLIAERCAEIVTSANDAIELMSPLAGTLSSDEFR